MILTSAQMGVDAHIPRRPAQALSFAIGYMLLGFWVTVLFGHSEIDHVDDLIGRTLSAVKMGLERKHSLLLPFVPGRPIRKLSGLMSR
jgi:hypothetical protein